MLQIKGSTFHSVPHQHQQRVTGHPLMDASGLLGPVEPYRSLSSRPLPLEEGLDIDIDWLRHSTGIGQGGPVILRNHDENEHMLWW